MKSRLRSALLLVALIASSVGLWWWLALYNAPAPAIWPKDYSRVVLDHNGVWLRAFTAADGRWRFKAELEQIDPRFLAQLLAIEDKNFYQHSGIDAGAIARASWNNLRFGRVVSGASTISMQLARLLEPQARSWLAKLQQAVLALRIEAHYSKAEILSAYLTRAPYGGNIEGIAAASWRYFGKSPQYLNVSQAALLLALPQAPERLRPDRHPGAARVHRNQVVDRLQQAGLVDSQQAQLAKLQAVPVLQALPFVAPHITERLLAGGNAEIQSTLDSDLQQRIEAIVQRHKQRLDRHDSVAVLVVENRSAAVRAALGSADYFATEYAGAVDMTRAIRSPGSALKPFIYGLAFDRGIAAPNTRIFDQPQQHGWYQPSNLDGSYSGEISLIRALQQSLNMPAVALLERLGTHYFRQTLQLQGVSLYLPDTAEPGLALALGGVGIRLQDLTALYLALANHGRYRPLRFLSQEEESSGSVLLPETASAEIAQILLGVTPPQGYVRNRHAIRFKTGTSYGFRDNWAVGFDQHYTVAVWVGRPDGAARNKNLGIETAAPILFEVFNLLPESRAFETLQFSKFNQLPRHLRWLQVAQGEVQALRFRITTPPDGAQLLPSKSGINVIRVNGGQPPYFWSLDGVPYLQTRSTRFEWPQQNPGFYQISVIDAEGRSDQVSLELLRKDSALGGAQAY